jgi:hypothetical protein
MSNKTNQVTIFGKIFLISFLKNFFKFCQLTKDNRLAPGNDAKDVTVLMHTYKCGEVSNPLGVFLEAQA